jgi:integrase
MALTVKQIETARHGVQKERMSDGAGLYVRLYPSGRKTFQAQICKSPNGTRRIWITLGNFPELGLKEARDLTGLVRLRSSQGACVEDIRRMLAKEPASYGGTAGIKSGRARLSEKDMTPFRDVAKVWFERKQLGLKNGKHIAQNWNTLSDYAFPTLGDRPVGQIAILDVVETLRPIWHSKNETARRTLGRVREVFELAKLEYGISVNPAIFSPDIAYGKYRRQTRHFGALDFERMAAFWDWLQEARCDEPTRQLCMLLVLSAKRTGETRFAEWAFFSESGDLWTTPGRLMKMRRAHRVPLSRQAQGILRNMKLLTGNKTHVFAKPGNKSGVICENAVLNLVKRFDPTITGHGFRATFKTWARVNTHYPHDVIEFSLAHEPDRLEAAYQRADLLGERRELMQQWADYITGGKDPVDLRRLVRG